MSDESQRLLDASQRLAATLTPGDLDATLSRITRAAVEILPQVEASSISILHADGRLETKAPTDDRLLEVDAKQYDLQEGPCYDAAVDSAHVISRDLATDSRYPNYGPFAVRAGIRSQAGIRLFDAPRSHGALNLYSGRPGAFDDFASLRQLFSDQAAVAISYAHEITNLREAMQTRQTIGQAVGIVMERYEMTDDRAFAFLTRLSQTRNVKLRLVAQELIAEAEQQGQE